jgi:K+-sensing histidine kinase KdpD
MIGRFRHFAALWVAGILILAFVTWACFQLGLNVTTTAFSFLIVIVLLSLLDSYVSSVLFSIVATGCLDYFFTEPLFSFTVASVEDITALAAFPHYVARHHWAGAAPAQARRSVDARYRS